MRTERTYRLGVLLVLVGGFHDLNRFGLVGDLGLVLVYLGGVVGVVGLVQSGSSDPE